MRATGLSIRSIRTTPVIAPLAREVRTATGAVTDAPLLLIDIETNEGVTGRAYLFSYFSLALAALDEMVRALAPVIVGRPLAPFELERDLRARLTLLGSTNLSGMAVAGLDMAAWDAVARSLEVPMATLLGGRPGVELRAYDSLGMYGPAEAAEQAARARSEGFGALKLKLGWPTLDDDIAAIRAVRRVVPDDFEVMVDYNQSLSVSEAVRRGQALDDEGVYWIEEPVRAADLEGAARVSAEVGTPVSIGENFSSVFEMQRALQLEAADYVMPDVQQVGGISGWIRAAALAQSYGVEMSSHCFPDISSHLLAVTPTAHWLEWLDLAGRVLAEPFAVRGGTLTVPDRPGLGLEWDPAAVERYRAG
ncbi:MAG: enolase C-terminal domain-like protein [Candidatus Dormibacteraceae bacterium]